MAKWRIARLLLVANLSITPAIAFTQPVPVPDILSSLESFSSGAVKVSEVKKDINYCPDNTCERFVGAKSASINSVAVYSFLYLFYFSDYYALKEWREKDAVQQQVKLALLFKGRSACDRPNDKQRAACILVHAEKEGVFKLFWVRYDERNVVVERNSLSKRFSRTELIDAQKP